VRVSKRFGFFDMLARPEKSWDDGEVIAEEVGRWCVV
jgi:hypothetical protein